MVAFLLGAFVLNSPLAAQTVASGTVGRIIIAPEIANAKFWPVDEERQASLMKPATIRRPTGHGEIAPFFEPNPALTLALVGAKGTKNPTELRIVGAQFTPAQIVASSAYPLKITNEESVERTIRYQESTLKIAPGETQELTMKGEGVQDLEIVELPYAHATVNLLKSTLFLPYDAKGNIPQTGIEPGDYRLVFFHGARKLLEQDLAVQTSAYVAIDATVSANAVVTVSLKPGVQVAPLRNP